MYDIIHEIENFSVKNPGRASQASKCIIFFQRNLGNNKIFMRNFFEDGHFTAGVLAFNLEKTKILLMKSSKSGTWQQFGGHADGCSDLREVALREFEEESGIKSDLISLEENIGSIDVHIVPERNHPEHGFEAEHYHYDINYYGTVSETALVGLDDPDVDDISWFLLDAQEIYKNNLSSGMKVMIEEYFLKQSHIG